MLELVHEHLRNLLQDRLGDRALSCYLLEFLFPKHASLFYSPACRELKLAGFDQTPHQRLGNEHTQIVERSIISLRYMESSQSCAPLWNSPSKSRDAYRASSLEWSNLVSKRPSSLLHYNPYWTRQGDLYVNQEMKTDANASNSANDGLLLRDNDQLKGTEVSKHFKLYWFLPSSLLSFYKPGVELRRWLSEGDASRLCINHYPHPQWFQSVLATLTKESLLLLSPLPHIFWDLSYRDHAQSLDLNRRLARVVRQVELGYCNFMRKWSWYDPFSQSQTPPIFTVWGWDSSIAITESKEQKLVFWKHWNANNFCSEPILHSNGYSFEVDMTAPPPLCETRSGRGHAHPSDSLSKSFSQTRIWIFSTDQNTWSNPCENKTSTCNHPPGNCIAISALEDLNFTLHSYSRHRVTSKLEVIFFHWLAKEINRSQMSNKTMRTPHTFLHQQTCFSSLDKEEKEQQTQRRQQTKVKQGLVDDRVAFEKMMVYYFGTYKKLWPTVQLKGSSKKKLSPFPSSNDNHAPSSSGERQGKGSRPLIPFSIINTPSISCHSAISDSRPVFELIVKPAAFKNVQRYIQRFLTHHFPLPNHESSLFPFILFSGTCPSHTFSIDGNQKRTFEFIL